jgi:hypothetical protein
MTAGVVDTSRVAWSGEFRSAAPENLCFATAFERHIGRSRTAIGLAEM